MSVNDPLDLPLVDGPPPAPNWLPNAHAVNEFNRLARILHANGLLTEVGISPLAMTCALFGKLVQLWSAGETPSGHLYAQYRALINDFGMTPVAQGKVRPGSKESANKFSKNGRKGEDR
jgi:hypothetical protein